MSIDPEDFDEFTKRFDKLTPEERDELLVRLEERRSALQQARASAEVSLFDAMNRRDMAGSIKDAPPDWSTNPKYLEGLGQDGE